MTNQGKSVVQPVLEHLASFMGDFFFLLGDSGKIGVLNAKESACKLLPHKVAINAT